MTEFYKAHPVTDKAFRARWKAEQEQRCQMCLITKRGMRLPGYAFFYKFETHHLIGGTNGRSDEACNLLLLCHRCHNGAAHNYGGEWDLKREHLLWAKMQTDKWNAERLWELAHRRYEPMELPAVYLEERERNKR